MEKQISALKELFMPVEESSKNSEEISCPIISCRADVWYRLKKNRLAVCSLIIIIILSALAAAGPYMTSYTYYEQDFTRKNLSPNMQHWFGTDHAGRDIFTRIWHGGRISLFIGLMAALLDFIIGTVYGGISGMRGGSTDYFMMRIAELLYSIPYLLMVILLMVVLGGGLWTIILAMTITGWIPTARLMRGQVLQLKEQEYVLASYALGGSKTWILRKHIIPNTIGLLLANMTLTVPSAIFAEATLSFMGLGIQAPKASWGTMTSDALSGLFVGNAYQLFIPAFFISLTMFVFNVLGDGLRDALDPQMRKQ